MRVAIFICIAIAIILLIFNLTQVNYTTPLKGSSSIALIGVVGSACAIILLLILLVSKKIARKQQELKRSKKID